MLPTIALHAPSSPTSSTPGRRRSPFLAAGSRAAPKRRFADGKIVPDDCRIPDHADEVSPPPAPRSSPESPLRAVQNRRSRRTFQKIDSYDTLEQIRRGIPGGQNCANGVSQHRVGGSCLEKAGDGWRVEAAPPFWRASTATTHLAPLFCHVKLPRLLFCRPPADQSGRSLRSPLLRRDVRA